MSDKIRSKWRDNYHRIPLNFLNYTKNPYTITLYVALMQFADNDTGKAYPSLKTLRELTGFSKTTIIKSIKELEDLGCISKVRVKSKNGDFTSNIYYIGDVHQMKQVVHEMDNGSTGDGITVVQEMDYNLNSNNLNSNNLKKEDPELFKNSESSNHDPQTFNDDNTVKEKKSREKFKIPTIFEIRDFAEKNNLDKLKVEEFFYYYESNGWKVGSNKMKNWEAAFRGWTSRNYNSSNTGNKKPSRPEKDENGNIYVYPPKEWTRDSILALKKAKFIRECGDPSNPVEVICLPGYVFGDYQEWITNWGKEPLK